MNGDDSAAPDQEPDETLLKKVKPAIRRKYEEGLSVMSIEELLDELEVRASRASNGYIDPVSRAMLRLVRREIEERLNTAPQKPKAKIRQSLF